MLDRRPPTDAPPAACDLAVIGAGVVGLSVARELLARRPGLRVAVFERGDTVAPHQTSHNSGVVHSGIYYAPGSLKARLAVSGAQALYAFCAERAIPHRRCGKVIVASSGGELGALDELERRGRANGVEGLRRLDAAGLADVEPHCRGVEALHSPDTGVVDFAAVARVLAGDVVAAGGRLALGVGITRVSRRDGGVALDHAHGGTLARRAVFCAGNWADAFAGADRDVRVIPFRGAYAILRPERAHLVNGLIYPVPDPRLPFLGVHLTRGVDDEVHVGPTALLVGARDAYRLGRIVPRDLAHTLTWPGTWRMARRWWRTAAGELRRAVSPAAVAADAARLVPGLRAADLLPGPAGVRGQAVARDGSLVDDFLLSGDDVTLHVRNAPSPAATAALALGPLIADRAEAAFGFEPVAR